MKFPRLRSPRATQREVLLFRVFFGWMVFCLAFNFVFLALLMAWGWLPPGAVGRVSGWAMPVGMLLLLWPMRRARLRSIQRLTRAHCRICPQCRYDLSGGDPAGQCPECGATYDNAALYLLWKESYPVSLPLPPLPGRGAPDSPPSPDP